MDMQHAAKIAAVRRARFAAWTVFVSMAATTMAFQCYHSVVKGQMPWELAVLFGVIPLLISIGILEAATEWEGAPRWVKYGPYAITAGAMYLSATSTGDIVVHAAPPRASALFGIILDAAALIAVYRLLNGPHPDDIRKAAEAEARAAAERLAAEERAEADERNALRRQIGEMTEAHELAVSELRAGLETARADLDAARGDTDRAVAEAVRQARITARKRGGATGRKRPPATARKPEAATGSATAPEGTPPEVAPDDLDSEAKVLWYIERGHSASKAGVWSGLTDGRGRQIARKAKELSQAAPRDIVDGAPADNQSEG